MNKPAKPYPDFPLFPHATKRWVKKIRGKMHYFGPWEDPDGALEKYLQQKESLHTGRTVVSEQPTVLVVAKAFLKHKRDRLNQGSLSPRTLEDYKEFVPFAARILGKDRLVSELRPDDFRLLQKRFAKRWGLYRLLKAIQAVRSMFAYAWGAEIITSPVRFGPDFKGPRKKDFRLERAAHPPKVFTAEEIRRLIDAASVHLKAMILLGINCGFGNSDCGRLPTSAVSGEWIDFPRPKTGVARRCALWPETVAAIRAAQEKRPNSKLVFVTERRNSFAKDTADNPITKETAKLLKELHINGRKGLGFYTLRHTFRTVADETKDQTAVDYIMGHETPNMSSVYRERISDERLKAVSDYVRKWLNLKSNPSTSNASR